MTSILDNIQQAIKATNIRIENDGYVCRGCDEPLTRVRIKEVAWYEHEYRHEGDICSHVMLESEYKCSNFTWALVYCGHCGKPIHMTDSKTAEEMAINLIYNEMD